jgi:hypothetical protein
MVLSKEEKIAIGVGVGVVVVIIVVVLIIVLSPKSTVQSESESDINKTGNNSEENFASQENSSISSSSFSTSAEFNEYATSLINNGESIKLLGDNLSLLGSNLSTIGTSVSGMTKDQIYAASISIAGQIKATAASIAEMSTDDILSGFVNM